MLDKTKMSSKELNDILINAQESFVKTRSDMDNMKKDLIEKSKVLKNEYEYGMHQLSRIDTIIKDSEENNSLKGVCNKVTLFQDSDLMGVYEAYGSIVHPRFIREPINLFNLNTSNGPIFRDNVSVSINEVTNERNKHILMHNNYPMKGINFDEYDEDLLYLNIKIDSGNLLGNSDFNVIEINPYLAGSFDIEILEVFSKDLDLPNNTEPIFTRDSIKGVGRTRIILDKKYSFLEVSMRIKLNYKNSNDKYPFGLRHMYFLNADFDINSHVVGKIEKNNFIETISNSIFLRDQFSKYPTTLTEKNIKIYLTNVNGTLEYELSPSSPESIKPLPRNTRVFYVHIPLKDTAISTLEFNDIQTR